MWLQGTNEIIRTLNDFYINNYKEALYKYQVELEFTTILTYYSGSCALVININSIPEANVRINMCIMLECSEKDLKDLNKDTLHSFFIGKIMKQYAGLFELNKVLCGKRINRKMIIKNTNFNEGILNIKLDMEVVQIELSYNKIAEINKMDKDLFNAIQGLSQHLENL
jgi:hypothetical protein